MLKRYQEFIEKYPHQIKRNIKLSRYCTFKVGGPADLFIDAQTPEELVKAIKLARKLDIPYFILAGGSNIFFDDKGFRGLIIHYIADDIEIDRKRMLVRVGAGCMLNQLIRHLAINNLGGMNFLANIPGSIGGAIVGNAGCYGQEIKDLLIDVDIFNSQQKKILTVKPSALRFSYRNSKLKKTPHLVVVLSARFRLIKGNKKKILKVVEEERQLRLSKHPQTPSAGSFFKNPLGQAAWRLINEAGMQGAVVGGARVSHKHSNFIINYHQATTSDILKLMNKVKRAVKVKTSITLEPEVRFVAQKDLVF